jgi:PAS domain S-box-containing protein
MRGGAVPLGIRALMLGVAYHVGAQVGVALQSPWTPHSILWLPNSILLATLLVVPVRTWPAYLLAALPAHLLVGWQAGRPMLTVSLLFVTNCLDALLGAGLVRRLGGGPARLDGLKGMLLFLTFGAALAPVVVSFADAAIVVLTGWGTDYWLGVITRVRSNVLTHVVLVPAMVIALTARPARLRAFAPRRWAEALSLTGGLFATALVVFTRQAGSGSLPALLYAPLPFLLWAAMRFGPGLTGGGLLLVAAVSIWSARRGGGPFMTQTPAGNIVALQFFLLAVSVPLLCLAAVVQDRRRTASALAESERQARRQLAQLEAIHRTAPVGLAFLDTDLRYVSVNDRLAQSHGLPAAAHIGRTLREIVPEVADELEPLYRQIIEGGEAILDREVRETAASRPGGERDWLVSYHPVKAPDGTVIGVNAVVQEITERKRTEAALRESQEALKASYRKIQDLAGQLITAQEAERARIALELHDDVNQRLAALAIALSRLRRRLPEAAAELRGELTRLQQRTVDVADAIRQLSHELHPGMLRHAGLVAALRGVCAEFGRGHGIEVTLTTADDGEPGAPDVALFLYRVAQESLRNVARHSGARRAWVTLARTSTGVELTVTDDGCGFDLADGRRRGGLGLLSIDERARLVGATVTIDTGPQRGTTLRVHVPQATAQPPIARTTIG